MRKKTLLDLAGAWNAAPEMKKIFENILKERHNNKGRKLRCRK